MSTPNSGFDYSKFPDGYYQTVMETGNPIRQAWHRQKFQRVVDCLPAGTSQSLLDIGCFAGSFLSLVDGKNFSRQVGVDILPSQIEFANRRFGTQFRTFRYCPSISQLELADEKFDCITIIEVIEHLTGEEIRQVLAKSVNLLKPGGRLIITTPNYTSAWPLLEILINRMSEVSYEEQHITKFNYFNIMSKLAAIAPESMRDLGLEFKTTTHFVSPFLAHLSLDFSAKISSLFKHRHWRFPFGNLILLSMLKK